MNHPDDLHHHLERERIAFCYHSALLRGDLETIAAALQAAEDDPVLAQLLLDLDALLFTEVFGPVAKADISHAFSLELSFATLSAAQEGTVALEASLGASEASVSGCAREMALAGSPPRVQPVPTPVQRASAKIAAAAGWLSLRDEDWSQ